MAKHKQFKDACEAQDFYLKQPNPMYWHWGYDHENNEYTLDFHAGVTASDKIIHIEQLEDKEQYVYDIETEDGTFQCGVGCMILKNTDSIYTKFILPDNEKYNSLSEEERLEKIGSVSEECADRITRTFQPPICLEFEKIMYPLILVSKKRYAYLGWEPQSNCTDLKNTGIEVKGLQLVKRDYCPFVRKIGTKILENLLIEKDIEKAKYVTREMISKLLQGKIPLPELIISKQLKSKYNETNKNGKPLSKPAHWHLAQRMKERDPMNAPKGGDRVSYVFVELDYEKNKNRKDILQHERIEDPEYVEQNKGKIKPDGVYYLERQVCEPIYTLFSVIVNDSEGNPYPLLPNNKVSKECKNKINKIWINELIKKQNQIRKQNQITAWFSKKEK